MLLSVHTVHSTVSQCSHAASRDPNRLFITLHDCERGSEERGGKSFNREEKCAENIKHADTKRFHFPFEPVDERDTEEWAVR